MAERPIALPPAQATRESAHADRSLAPEQQSRACRTRNPQLAFIRALRLLHLVDRNDPVWEIVARRIIEIGATGAGDPVVISEIAVRKLIDAYGGGSTEVLVPKPARSSERPTAD